MKKGNSATTFLSKDNVVGFFFINNQQIPEWGYIVSIYVTRRKNLLIHATIKNRLVCDFTANLLYARRQKFHKVDKQIFRGSLELVNID